MELTPGRQRLLFVVVVIVLVGLGIFVIRGRNNGSTAAPATTPTQSASAAAASAAATGTPTAASSAPASSPAASTPAAAGGTNIYQWLPFTQSDLGTAAKTTLAFASVYANTSYTETKAAYAAKLAGLTTTQEAATLEADFETPGVSDARIADKQVATGTPTIDSISSFGPQVPPGPAGPPSITFLVTIAQKLASTSGTQTSTPEYTITIASTAAGWQVNNIQLASLGNT
jgi:hypothetical protein